MRKVIFLLVMGLVVALSITYYKRKEILAARIAQLLAQNGLTVDALDIGFLGWENCQIKEMILKSQSKEDDWQINIKNAHVNYLLNMESYLNIQSAEIDDLIVIMGTRRDSLTETQTTELVNRYIQEMLIPALHLNVHGIKINNFEINSAQKNQEFHLKTMIDFDNQQKSLTLKGYLSNAHIFPFEQIRWQGTLVIEPNAFNIVLQSGFRIDAKNYQQADTKIGLVTATLSEPTKIQWLSEASPLSITANEINFDVNDVNWDKDQYLTFSGQFSKLFLIKKDTQWQWEGDLSLVLPETNKKISKLSINAHGSSTAAQHIYQLSGHIENPSVDLRNVTFDLQGTANVAEKQSKAVISKCKLEIEAYQQDHYKIEPMTIWAKNKLNFILKEGQVSLMPSQFEISPMHLRVDDKSLIAKNFDISLEKIDFSSIKLKGLLDASQIAVKWQDFEVSDIDLNIDFVWQKDNFKSDWTFLKPLKIGVDLEQLAFTLNMNTSKPAYEYAIQNMQAKILGGDIQSEAILIKDKKLVQGFKLIFSNIQLEQLFAWRKVDGLSGTGSLNGTLPCFFTEKGFEIKGGVFSAKEPGGKISYIPLNRSKSDIAGMEMAFKALQDFQYSALNAKIEYKTDGWMNLALSLKGKSDLLGEGRPVEFNLNLDENIKDLLKSMALVNKYSRADYIEHF
ncbi:YdbH domain-containing protein [Candidatus Berkiella cookevillensis]|uniref:YdbH domain-containing protein n=1 Tax=Candidatus Berkiella cookevillensis TaxID=437022 RepID=A0A0Q9YUB2_9GAMM|nr:YdbH domain-containing protein [Candidatus Berkiella cookevillensis]MCS5708230.1 YdbH domain-containing protein [Candidatus Berkiella cookevillensis]